MQLINLKGLTVGQTLGEVLLLKRNLTEHILQAPESCCCLYFHIRDLRSIYVHMRQQNGRKWLQIKIYSILYLCLGQLWRLPMV